MHFLFKGLNVVFLTLKKSNLHRYLFIVIVISACCKEVNAQEKRYSFTREKMASPFTIIFYDKDSTTASNIANDCFTLVDSFVNIFSDYIEKSELNQLSKSAGSGRHVPVSPALLDIISISQKAYKLSNGAFDITLGPVIRLWRKARREKIFPADSSIENSLKKVGFDKVIVDTTSGMVQLTVPGMQLDLGGIAQGYIARKVLERLAQHNRRTALVDVSGDIATGGAPPGKNGWIIGINVPESEKLQRQQLQLNNVSVSTSGDIYQFIEHQGKKYSHIVNPRTGYGVTSQRNVTVIADDATTADWLATACSILPVKKALRLAKKQHAEVLVAEMKKAKIVQSATKKFSYFYYLNKRND
jgi:thiamine biosynthesis lipoprotein